MCEFQCFHCLAWSSATRPPGRARERRPRHRRHPPARAAAAEIITQERLEASKQVVLGLLEAWENNQFVVNKFKGEIFCSGYGIWVDYRVNPEGHRRLFDIMERCDGVHTVADIATELNISFQAVWEVVNMLKEKDLVWLSRIPHSTSPSR